MNQLPAMKRQGTNDSAISMSLLEEGEIVKSSCFVELAVLTPKCQEILIHLNPWHFHKDIIFKMVAIIK